MNSAFSYLGGIVESTWRKANYQEAVFPDLCANALAEAGLTGTISPNDVFASVLNDRSLPRQEDLHATFSNLPVTLYHGPRFYIGLLNWLDGTTSIHQHSFSGAFQVLAGSSIHGIYGFTLDSAVNDRLLTGRILLRDIELLRTGDIRPIPAGSRFIHSLFHLDRPSTTLIIRTYDEPTKKPQYTYLKPGIAFDPFFEEETTVRQIQTISYLLESQHPDRIRWIEEFLAGADFQTSLYVLEKVSSHVRGGSLATTFGIHAPQRQLDGFLDIVHRRHAHLAEFLPPLLKEQARLDNIILRRKVIADPEHRFFLALLLNVPSRAQILDLVGRRYPGEDPVETVTNWVESLTSTRQFGARESNVLGLENFDDQTLFVFQCLLEGKAESEIVDAVDAEFPPALAESLKPEVKGIEECLRQSILSPLFAD